MRDRSCLSRFASEDERVHMVGSITRTHGAALAAIGVVLAGTVASPAWAASFDETGWGFNRGGQLGDESNVPSDVPVPVKGLSGVVSVSGGGDNNMALLNDGTVMGFGVNGVGELCDGTHTKADVPVPVDGVSEAAAVAVGGYDTLILLRDGTIMACGGNHYGQLGNGTMGNDFNVARPVLGLSGVTAIAAQGDTSLALLANGTVMAWGKNDAGQLGDGNQTASDVPVPVSALHNVLAIAAGRKYSLALLSNGTVMSWGANELGQLGNGTTTSSDTPVPVRGLTEVAAISAGTSSLALLKNGTVMSWGENRTGQLGDGNSTNSDVPVPVSGLRGVSAVSSGSGFDLALLSGGGVTGWGENFAGQLGDGNTSNTDLPVPVTGLKEVAGIAATSGNDSFAYGPSQPSVSAPVITEVNGRNGPASGGVVVTITGASFTGATAVRFGSVNAGSFTVKSASSIAAVSPAEAVGRVNVSVTTPTATTDPQAVDSYLFRPSVVHLTPDVSSAAGGVAVTITGSGFTPGRTGTSFEFGSTKATSVSCASTSTCVVVAPAHAAGVTQVVATTSGIGSPKTTLSKFVYR
jgi:alpha-tubulin suppressor-like RCC1 family protein